MSGDRDAGLDEKRVYGGTAGRRIAFVATGDGLARVGVSGARIGEFGLAGRDPVTDVAAAGGRLAVATPEDVLLGSVADAAGTGSGKEEQTGLAPTGFGPASAVAFRDGPVAAGGGRVARYDPATGEWTRLGDVADVRAIDGGMVAAAGGVFRLDGTPVGLADARDVAVGDAVYAATGDGLYWLANGWRPAIEAPVGTVACEAPAAGAAASDRPARAHAATPDGLYERAGADDRWTRVDGVDPGPDVTGVAYAPGGGGADANGTVRATYAVAADGTLLATAGEGWRDRSLGLADARAIVVA